jgi:hypothetical protein
MLLVKLLFEPLEGTCNFIGANHFEIFRHKHMQKLLEDESALRGKGGEGGFHPSKNINTNTESRRSERGTVSDSSISEDTQDGSGASNSCGEDTDME